MNSPTGAIESNISLTITVKDLSKRFNREWIFRHLDFQFVTGSTYAITGPNGSGKSTFLQVLWGQLPQSSGTIQYQRDNQPVPIEDVFQYLSIATPYMDLIDEFTLREMVNFHFRLKKLRNGLHVEDLFSLMYLEEATDKQLINFSSGMKQRVKLALAFYTDADVYFVDEPGTNLDERAFQWYLTHLSQLSPEAMVFIASNNREEYPEKATILNMRDFKR